MATWKEEEIEFLKANYPERGKAWCMAQLNRTDGSIRRKAADLELKQNQESEFFKDWQSRAAKSKVGKKRPEQALVIKKTHADGKFKKTPQQKKAISERMKKFIATHGHPRGATGMKHTKETKEKLSKKSKEKWASMPEEKRDEYAKRGSELGKNSWANREKASWKAAWREIGGYKKYYRSRWEANYARYLEWLKVNNKIVDWKHEDTTFWFEGIKRGVMSYLPDFHVFKADGIEEYHEVKGWMDDRSKTKLKRMAKYHPNIILILIDSKSYRVLEKEMKDIIPDWE